MTPGNPQDSSPPAKSVESAPPPELGEHTIEVLHGLGYDQEALAALLDKGVAKGFNPEEFTWAPVRDKR